MNLSAERTAALVGRVRRIRDFPASARERYVGTFEAEDTVHPRCWACLAVLDVDDRVRIGTYPDDWAIMTARTGKVSDGLAASNAGAPILGDVAVCRGCVERFEHGRAG